MQYREDDTAADAVNKKPIHDKVVNEFAIMYLNIRGKHVLLVKIVKEIWMKEASDALSKTANCSFAKCIASLLHYYTCKTL